MTVNDLFKHSIIVILFYNDCCQIKSNKSNTLFGQHISCTEDKYMCQLKSISNSIGKWSEEMLTLGGMLS